MRPLVRAWALSSAVLLAALAAGCAGSAPPAAEPTGQQQQADTTANTVGAENDSTYHVTLYTDTGQLDVEDFTVEISNRKFLRQLFGFRPRALKTMTSIPFEGVSEIQIMGQIPDQDFAVVFEGRERSGLQKTDIFDTRIRYPNGDVVDFYAIITKLRGYREVQRWEQAFSGNPIGLRRIEFR